MCFLSCGCSFPFLGGDGSPWRGGGPAVPVPRLTAAAEEVAAAPCGARGGEGRDGGDLGRARSGGACGGADGEAGAVGPGLSARTAPRGRPRAGWLGGALSGSRGLAAPGRCERPPGGRGPRWPGLELGGGSAAERQRGAAGQEGRGAGALLGRAARCLGQVRGRLLGSIRKPSPPLPSRGGGTVTCFLYTYLTMSANLGRGGDSERSVSVGTAFPPAPHPPAGVLRVFYSHMRKEMPFTPSSAASH